MRHYCNPLNIEYKYQFYRKLNAGEEKPPFTVYREAADPSLILFRDTYFLFPSMTAGFLTSDDLHEWKFYEFLGDIPVYGYAPDVRVRGEYLYFSASCMGENGSFYRSKDPRTEPFEEIPGTFPFWDPNLFVDDDGRMYFYWGSSNQEPLYGIELDPDTMRPAGEKQSLVFPHPENRGYERFGEDHRPPKSEEQIEAEVEGMLAHIRGQENARMSEEDMRAMLRGLFGNSPYIEGAWMTKHKGKYYLQFGVPGTEFNVYGDGVYTSYSPLGPFTAAANNPYSYKPGGFLTGAGHGSTLEDKNGNFWHASTIQISYNANMERRIGLWKAGFDDDGELYCDQRYGDWPVAMDAKAFDDPDWMLLSYGKDVTVSSGTGAGYITDESIKTFWKAAGNAPGEWACVDLGAVYEVCAVQINFADDGMTKELPEELPMLREMYEERYIDTATRKTRWLLEVSADGMSYNVVADKRNAETDLAHDFVEFDEKIRIRYIRLTVEELPYGQTPAVSGIRVFGKGEGELPKEASDVLADYDGQMDMQVSWKTSRAAGAVVLWGHAADKLYHSRMVYGKENVQVGALVTGQPVYVRVDTFNENGIVKGKVITVKK